MQIEKLKKSDNSDKCGHLRCSIAGAVLDSLASLLQLSPGVGSNDGEGSFANPFPTASRKKLYTDRPCCTQVAIPVPIRSQKRRPVSLRVPCVVCRSITTNGLASVDS